MFLFRVFFFFFLLLLSLVIYFFLYGFLIPVFLAGLNETKSKRNGMRRGRNATGRKRTKLLRQLPDCRSGHRCHLEIKAFFFNFVILDLYFFLFFVDLFVCILSSSVETNCSEYFDLGACHRKNRGRGGGEGRGEDRYKEGRTGLAFSRTEQENNEKNDSMNINRNVQSVRNFGPFLRQIPSAHFRKSSLN